MPPRTSLRPASPWLFGSTDLRHICSTCARQFRRRLASQVALGAGVRESQLQDTKHPVIAHRLLASVILSRPPQISRDLHPFEKAFFLYQKRLNERLALPFTRYMYFKNDTPAIIDFRRKIKQRKTPARDIGVYDAYGEYAWQDEVLEGAQESEPEHQKEALLEDEEQTYTGENILTENVRRGEEKPRPMPRVTKADVEGDEKSLNRLLQRTLYLMVLSKENRWQFPTAPLDMKESLRKAADRILLQTAGRDMNTWIVANHPIGHLKIPYKEEQVKMDERGQQEKGELLFFMKGRIMAGQANIEKNELGVQDFKWLCREEIQSIVHPKYWSSVYKMLPER